MQAEGTILNGWSVLDELTRLQDEMNRLFDFGGGVREASFPALNVWVSDDAMMVEAEVPGVDAEHLDVSVEDGLLTISGERMRSVQEKDVTWHRTERPFGRFSRSLELPFRVDAAKVTAAQRNGILRVTLPRAEEDKPRKIAIQAGPA